MRASELEKMFHLEDTYWWFVARRIMVRDLLAQHLRRSGARPAPRIRILDVGCGTGATLKVLAQSGAVTGLDSSRAALDYSRQRGRWQLALARGEELPIASGSLDVIVALDLLEHIADDGAAAAEFARALRPGGLLLVTVPALSWLWSQHDEALDHLRRYQAARLRHILEQAGFHIERLSPLIFLLLAPIAVLRWVQRLLPRRNAQPETAFIVPPRPVNWLLTAIVWLENQWALRWNLPAGVSLMAVARKP